LSAIDKGKKEKTHHLDKHILYRPYCTHVNL